MIQDRNINYKYKKDWQPITSFNTFVGADGASVDALTGTALTEVGSLGVVGLAQGTAGNKVRCMFPVPSYWDVENDIFVRVIWTDVGTTSNTATYIVTYNELSFGAAPAAGSTALDTVIAADAHCGVSNGINATTWGKINGNSISADYLVVDVEMDAESGTLNAVTMGIEWAYLPKLTDGAQSAFVDAPTDA